ncbi:MAG: LemA family protein [Thermodesulfovibrionales bacterium]|nr:LemA family protein [Thermodesulfovibrionales bacterium]
MSERDDLNKVLKKVYATELEIIEDVKEPSLIKRQSRLNNIIQSLKQRLWEDHTTAIKICIISFILAFVSATIYYYNFFIVNSYLALQEKANVEAHLQRRADLIPNLVKAASSYLVYEKNIFGHIAEIRGAVAGLKTLEESIDKLGIKDKSALSKFQAVAEAYPALKASETYTALMKELSDTETKLAESRIKYNAIVNYYNSRLELFPGVIFNTLFFRFKPLPVFESDKSPTPDVQHFENKIKGNQKDIAR